MTVKINADTTNGLVMTPDTSGEIELQASGTKIATVKSTGIEMASGKTINNADTIKEGETWILTSNIVGGGSFTITSNLSRYTQDSASQMGTGLTESSGVFSFPSTGHYFINCFAGFSTAGSDTSASLLFQHAPDGSTFSNVLRLDAGQGTGNAISSSPSASCILDITDTSNQKIRLATFSLNSTLIGQGSLATTGFTVIRLGNT